MCGIVGFVNTLDRADARSLLERMNTSLVHRGPDEAGYFLSRDPGSSTAVPPGGPQVGLAMRRLAIIDLKTGQQPIPNEDETAWIVFNGEIYNHQELRRELEARGHRFRTQSDTEAILHAYEEYGVECVGRLRGMFAFAIWDSRQERLFLARDHVGIKPLYWWQSAGRLLFGSEIKALFQEPSVPRRVNREGLHHYLTYLYAPAPLTMFEEIRQLPPGHRMVWQRGKLTVEEYWAGPQAMLERDAGDPVSVDEVWDVLRESVSAHMLSDVPLGAFLSGGLDSTAIVALMAELSSRPVKTFSIGFRAAGLYNELGYARQVAEHFRTDHHELDVEPDAVGLLPEIIRHLDEPLADASVIPNYLVARLARQSVTVALTGIGGDELFGGYRRYYGDAMAGKWKRIPRPLRRNVLLPALRLIPASGETALGDTSRLAQKFLEPLDLDPERRYLAWNAFFTEEAKRRLYPDGSPNLEFAESGKVAIPHFQRVRHRPFADRAMYVDLKSYLPGDPLFLGDRMTMANSLEARVPFVDLRVMEFAARVPLSQKIQGRTTKAILRQALAGHVSDEIIHRPKRGFGTPIDLWLRRELSGLADRLLSPELLRERGYFRPEYVAWLRGQQASGKQDFSQHIWALLIFELWHRAFIDADLSTRQGLTFEDLGLGSGVQAFRRSGVQEGDRGIQSSIGALGAQPHTPESERPASPPQPATPERLNARTPERLRILMLADVDPVHVIGGGERILNEHCRRLAARGHRIVVLTRRENPSLPPEEEHCGVRVVRHPVDASGTVGFMRSVLRKSRTAFERLQREESFDLINVHQPLAAAGVVEHPEARGLPVLYTYLSPWADEYRTRFVRRVKVRNRMAAVAARAWMHVNSHARQRMERRVLARSDRMLVLSEFTTSQLQEIHGIPADRVTRVPGGVDTERFHPPTDRAALRRKLGLPGGLLLLTVRNLVPRMGLDSLIAAMPAIVRSWPDASLCIGGAGPLKPRLEEQVRDLGLERHVCFAGFIPEERLRDYYGAADAFVLPTRCLEGFGLVTVEALACGTPVIGTPIGGTREILQGFDSRFLAHSPEPHDLAARLLERLPEIYQNDELRERCRQHALATFSWEVLIPQVEDLMLRLIAARA
jgi:asparagine synthase (glutamine-hydrolysing)